MYLNWIGSNLSNSNFFAFELFGNQSNFSQISKNKNNILAQGYDLISPIPKIGKLNINIQYVDCKKLNIVEEDKDLIAGLINYKFNSSGFHYMLSLKYPRMEDLGNAIIEIINVIFSGLNKIFGGKPLTYEIIYNNLHLFDMMQKFKCSC